MPVQKEIDSGRVIIIHSRILKKKNSLNPGKNLMNTLKNQKDFINTLNSSISSLKVKKPAGDEKVILSSLAQLQSLLSTHERNLDEQICALNDGNSYLLSQKMLRERQILASSYIITNKLKSTKAGFLADKRIDLKKVASRSSVAMTAIAMELLNINQLLKKNRISQVNSALSRIKSYISSLK